MTYEEEKLTRLRRQLSKQAIDQAMAGQWRDAVETNKAILADFPKDVDACNRLGRAYMELGKYSQAKEAYNHAIEHDPYNAIARKNLQRLNYLKETRAKPVAESRKVEPQQFIEEIGKAGVVNLYRLAPREVRARMVAGDKVKPKVDGPALKVENSRGEYLGHVEPRHTPRLIKLMDGGNRYEAAVVSSTEDAMTVIIREVYQHPSQTGRLSFPSKGAEEFKPYAAERIMKMEEEYEEEEAPGYTIVGGGEIEVLPEEKAGVEDEMFSNEE